MNFEINPFYVELGIYFLHRLLQFCLPIFPINSHFLLIPKHFQPAISLYFTFLAIYLGPSLSRVGCGQSSLLAITRKPHYDYSEEKRKSYIHLVNFSIQKLADMLSNLVFLLLRNGLIFDLMAICLKIRAFPHYVNYFV